MPGVAAPEVQRRAIASPVRVGYLMSRYPAVSHTFFLHEVRGLRARGMEIFTASINRPDRPVKDLPESEAAEAARTYYVKGSRKLWIARTLLMTTLGHPAVVVRGLLAILQVPRLSLQKRLFWLLYLAEALLVGSWMRRKRLEHLHVHFGGPVATVGLLVAKAWRIPLSLTIHGPEELLQPEANHLREKLETASFVFCISEFCKQQLCLSAGPEHWDKFSVIRLGVEPMQLTLSNHNGVRGPQRTDTAPVRMVCTGRLVTDKGHSVLLDALALVKAHHHVFCITLIGDGPERGRLEQQVARLGLTEQVRFTGALSHGHTLAELHKADVFTLASFAEGIPVALMEAMGLGIPCVSTSIAGIPELIQSGTDGLLVPPGNPEALAAALESLITDPALRRRLGGAGRQRILREYNLGLNQERLLAAFSERLQPLAASQTTVPASAQTRSSAQ